MKTPTTLLISALTGAVALALALPAQAQTATTGGEIAAPDYDSDASVGSLSNHNFNTPESDGRPGVYYFDLGGQAFKKGDYRHAIDMYKVAASWAYKPAEYDLGLMYFKGQGVPVDRARGAAWMIMAAERGDALYVKARDLMVTALTKPEFQHADEIWNQLKPIYSDAVALRRAKVGWARAGTSETGSHLGHALQGVAVGAPDGRKNSRELISGPSIDGSVAYQQFQKSDNPYDPIFLKNRTGTATIGPLQQVKPGNGAQPSNDGGPASSASSLPPSSGIPLQNP